MSGYVLIDKAALSLRKVSAKSDSRYDGIHVAPDGTVRATNGHVLLKLAPCPLPVEDYPTEPASLRGTPIGPRGVLINTEAADRIDKAIPKCPGVPILVAIVSGDKVATTDLENTLIQTVQADHRFSDTVDAVIPKDGKAANFDARYLKSLCEIAIKNGPYLPQVCLIVGTEPDTQATRIEIPMSDGRMIEGAIMPVRRDK